MRGVVGMWLEMWLEIYRTEYCVIVLFRYKGL